ncbi:MAG TPA: hypothetical protein VKX28_26860 [Xanthobacteraceae bacterium]|nr:hypothetical protein [Xanthobacteraceae bacterium]
MVGIPLTSGAYSAQGYIANAQRCVNLYPERNPPETKPVTPFTLYPRPGLRSLALCPAPGPGRCLYRSTRGGYDPNGDLFAVVGVNVYAIDPDWNFHLLGQMRNPLRTPVSMADNGTAIIVVDGSTSGNQIVIAAAGAAYSAASFTEIGDPNFLGSTRADFLDTFILLNKPGTNQWYCTLQGQIAFNGLYVGVKTAWPDNILCVVAIEREAWVFGSQKNEPWYNAGAVPFPFQLLPGVIIEQGCVAAYSPAKMDTNVFWLSQSPEGARMVMRGNNQNVAQRISTHAIEAEFKKYARVDDAIGSVYQIAGHSFYKLHFPTADKTWGFDQATEQWHEDAWIDNNGVLHRARNTFMAYAYGKNVGLDWATGQLYEVTADALTDAGQPIPWIRSFPHALEELKQVSHAAFVADVQTGTDPGTGEVVQFRTPWNAGFSQGFGPLTQVASPVVYMRMSRDGGNTFGNARAKGRLSAGRYRSLLRWRNNGIARDAVFELSSTAEMSNALNGAFIDPVVGNA